MHKFKSIELVSLGNEKTRDPEVTLASQTFEESIEKAIQFLRLQATGRLKDSEGLVLRLHRSNERNSDPPIEIKLPHPNQIEQLPEN